MRETEVLLLARPDCSFCDEAKRVLDALSLEHPLAVRVLDAASEEGRELAQKGGILFPPGVFLDGQPFSYGRLSQRKLRKALERASTRT
ncbi:MAG: glutaredoxin family protein [Solirubrobacteraceae bacterium]